MRQPQVPVLVVGGGPVGLCASIFLSRQGVRSLLVERHAGTALHPKARGQDVRTMELFRPLGIERELRAAALPPEHARSSLWLRSLAEPEFRRATTGANPELARPYSPASLCGCPQDQLEPVLLQHARSYDGADLRFGTELVSFGQDADGVTARIADRAAGEVTEVRASFMVAADGASSGVRRTLAIEAAGPVLDQRMSILFRADLRELVRGRESLLYWIHGPAISGLFLAMNNADRWNFHVTYRPEAGQSPADFTPAHCTELIRRAAGVPDLEVEVVSALPWVLAAQVAERFREGPVFLAGDAAHLIPPTGGYGMNTGIQDVHNLAWKLGAVLKGWAGPALLDTYEDERRPVARFNAEQALVNAQEIERGGGPRTDARMQGIGVVLGFSYRSAAVLDDGTPPPQVEDPVTTYLPSARPGQRAPHLWLTRDGAPVSTIDLFGSAFVLLAGREGREWCSAAARVAASLAVPLEAYTVGPSADLVAEAGAWEETYGTTPRGAVLVRPDGHVGWRTPGHEPVDPGPELARALRTLTARA